MFNFSLVLFRVSLLLNFKSHQDIEFLCLNLFILNLPLSVKEDVTANQENFLKVLAFLSYTKIFKVLKKGGVFFNLHFEKNFLLVCNLLK